MGRVSDSRERLIDAMIELIWTGSYGTTSVDQICDRAEVKKGSFYHHFESKQVLARECVKHCWAEYRKQLDQVFSASKPPTERLLDVIRMLCDEQRERFAKHGRVLGCPMHSLAAEMTMLDQEFAGMMMTKLQEYLRYFESAIRDGHAEGLFDAPNAAEKARIIFSYTEGLLVHARIWNDLSVLNQMESGVLDILRLPKLEAALA